MRHRLGYSLAVVAGLAALLLAADSPKPYTTWSDYGGGIDSMQYSALKLINKTNVAKLELAWSYKVPDHRGNFGFNPIVANGKMYILGRENAIVALDPAAGREIWSHKSEQNIVTQRGIMYWSSKDGKDRRLIYGAGSYLYAINADTGVGISTFGEDGRINMRVGTPRPLGGPSATPGRIWENRLIVGSQTGEGYGSAPGDLRAYDVVSGKLLWSFHTIPHPGEFGYDTWPKDAWTYVGGVNTWGEISVDEKRGIGYFPLGSPTHDMYGGDRKGANLFGDCILALDLRTGKRLWHYQLVHHDLWDYDPTTAPKLLTVKHDGRMVDIVAQPTKFGLLYVFNRVTGEPLWPIEERPVPKSDVPGEESWPTQPFPTKPAPFARLSFGVDDLNPYVDAAERERLQKIVRESRNEGLFTPLTLGRTQISIPGELGGSNWGGSAADPTTGMLYVRAANQPGFHTLREPGANRSPFGQHCQGCHGDPALLNARTLGADRIRRTVRGGQGQMPPFEPDTLPDNQLNQIVNFLLDGAAGGGGGRAQVQLPPPPEGVTRYTGPLGSMFRTTDGMVAIAPPWGEIVAYDLNEGTIKWRAPVGTVPALAAKGIRNTGNAQRLHRNGPAVTAGGLIFMGTAADRMLLAYDKDNGKILWETSIEGNPEGLVSTFEINGRQYVAFCASGTADENTQTGQNAAWLPGKLSAQGYYIYALPKGTK